jgi:hypothetical protein
LSYAVVVAYLFSLGVAQAVSFDYHIETFAPLFAFVALWGLARDSRWPFWLSCIAILTLKEDGALLTLAICWLAWFAFHRRSALPIALIAVAYMLFATSIIIPHYRSDDLNPFLERYGYLSSTPVGLLWGIVSRPDLVVQQLANLTSLKAVGLVFASGAFLALLKPKLMPAIAVVTLLALLSKQPPQGALDLHYLLIPSTVALMIAIIALHEQLPQRLARRFGATANFDANTLPTALLLATAALLWLVLSPLPPSLAADRTRFTVTDHDRVAQRFLDQIPDAAIVSAQSPFVAHLAARRSVYQFPRVLDAEYVLVDAYGDIPKGDLQSGYDDCLRGLDRLGFDAIRSEDGLTLWRKNRPAVTAPDVSVACSGQHAEVGRAP